VSIDDARQLMTNLTDALLDPLLAGNRMGPRITYYDDATGERIELSTVTLANWAAKTANLLRDELGAGPGSRIGPPGAAYSLPRTGRYRQIEVRPPWRRLPRASRP
jgi:hypothetical protein